MIPALQPHRGILSIVFQTLSSMKAYSCILSLAHNRCSIIIIERKYEWMNRKGVSMWSLNLFYTQYEVQYTVWNSIIFYFCEFLLEAIPNIALGCYDSTLIITSWYKPIISIFLHIARYQLYHGLVECFISSLWVQVRCNPDLVVGIAKILKAKHFKHKPVATTTGHTVSFTRSFHFYNTCVLVPLYFQTNPELCMEGEVMPKNSAAWEGKIN